VGRLIAVAVLKPTLRPLDYEALKMHAIISVEEVRSQRALPKLDRRAGSKLERRDSVARSNQIKPVILCEDQRECNQLAKTCVISFDELATTQTDSFHVHWYAPDLNNCRPRKTPLSASLHPADLRRIGPSLRRSFHEWNLPCGDSERTFSSVVFFDVNPSR
jgi:hypothetical protein